MHRLFRVILAITLLVAGMVGNASAQTYAGLHEFNICAIPQQIVIANENVGFPSVYYQVQRYVQYPGQPLVKMYAQPGYTTGKNLLMSPTAAPQQVQNCSNGGPFGTQWLSFRVKTTNYFGSGVADHLVFGMRGAFTTSSYDAIGIIFHPYFGGIMGERFRFGIDSLLSIRQTPTPQPQLGLQDGKEYLVEILAAPDTISYRITNVTNNVLQDWRAFANPAGYPLINGTGLMFAVLCNGAPGANCDNFTTTPFRVDIWAIASGWV